MTVRCLKKLATCLFLPVALHFQTPTFAQTKLPEIIPPSPNAAAFSKYGNIPISAYTGVPNIQIPLYTIKVRDITVPISLSYHASGIKVTEEASRVGLGWVLNCGGVISRNIINKDDFLASPEAYHSPLNDAPELPLGAEYAPSFDLQYGTEIQYYNVHGDPNTPTLFTLNLDDWIRSTDHDFQPDQYNYNVAGHSGKFVLTRDREAVIEKNEKLLIEVIGQGDSWKVTTPDGFIYKFETYEYFRDFENPPASEQRSAWYLTKIISPQGEEVTFNYETTTEQYVKPAGGLSET
ncbi:MAG TPA: hypothetical protein VEB86_05500, partial [Chryseosolibacter sp.]|nr:hypothetical protein [Chryseosolibacter sp.]